MLQISVETAPLNPLPRQQGGLPVLRGSRHPSGLSLRPRPSCMVAWLVGSWSSRLSIAASHTPGVEQGESRPLSAWLGCGSLGPLASLTHGLAAAGRCKRRSHLGSASVMADKRPQFFHHVKEVRPARASSLLKHKLLLLSTMLSKTW